MGRKREEKLTNLELVTSKVYSKLATSHGI
jgi:hypothetical protein